MQTTSGSAINRNNSVAIALVISLFFLWALTSNLLPSMIPHLKKACRLNDFQSAFIDSAYWIAYFVVAIPASIVIRRFNYKTGIICGLLIATAGALLFYPAAESRTFGFFLFALFLVASGMTFLETAANPYMTVIGDPETSSQRLNFAQAFNGLGAFIAAFFLSKMILSGKEYDETAIAAMSSGELESYLRFEADRVKLPYLGIAAVLAFVAILFMTVKIPDVKDPDSNKAFNLDFSVFRRSHFSLGVLAQFFYVGAQVCVSSFFIRYAGYSAGINELAATDYLGYLLLCFMVGRYVGTFLMLKIPPQVLLAVYSVINIVLLSYCVFYGGLNSLFALMAVEFFMSIMFPTIFALSIKDLGRQTKIASSFLVMSIVGGAIIPLALGYISRNVNIQVAYAVPLICFFVTFYYGWRGYRVQHKVDEAQTALA
jgi:MFS transporter, FHS family, L-fucose permease